MHSVPYRLSPAHRRWIERLLLAAALALLAWACGPQVAL